MANKKLKVELELETAKAKRQAKGLENIDGPSGGYGGGSDKLAKNLERAADSAGKMDRSTLSVVRAFTGIGVGLAANYAASHMRQGAARDAVEYGGNALTGASAGAMAGAALGPAGSVVGALVGGGGGLLKTYLDKSGEKEKYTEDWQRSEHDYKNNKAFADFFRNLTDMSDKGKSFADRISEAEAELQKYKDVEKTLMENVEKMIASGRYDDATAQRGYLATNRQRQQQLEAAIKGLGNQAKTGGVAYYSGTDALAKVGGGNGKGPPGLEAGDPSKAHFSSVARGPLGSFFFGNSGKVFSQVFGQLGETDIAIKTAIERIAQLEKEGNDILKEIAEHTKRKDGATWQ